MCCLNSIENVYFFVVAVFPGIASGEEPTCHAGDLREMGSIPGQEDPLEKGMATHSSILPWRSP